MYDSLKADLPEEIKFHIRCMSRIVYYVTDSEDLFLVQLRTALEKHLKTLKVWNPAFGLHPLEDVVDDWEKKVHPENSGTMQIHNALMQIYKDNNQGKRSFYVITDADQYMNDAMVVRRLLNILHQLHSSETTAKVIFLVSSRLVIPPKLQKHVEVVYDKGLVDESLKSHVEDICKKFDVPAPNTINPFRGLTAAETEAAIAQSVVATKAQEEGSRIDLKLVGDFKRRQLKKTDLIKHVETGETSFEVVGGVSRFKKWVQKTKANWTEEGQSYGLVPPKGVMAIGVWGCGKSLSVQAMAHAWRLPLLLLELGKLRQSGLGDSEANVYKAISLIESMAPCIVWADEADKTFSGAQSSALTDGGTTNRMIGILSTWLQETKLQVCLAMTANNIANVPPEFVRRANKRWFFDLPSEDERLEILKIHLLKQRQDPKRYQLANLADLSKKMVGSEIEQALQEAMTESFDADKDHLDEEILKHELRVRPRIFKTLGDDIRDMRNWVGYDSTAKDGIRASLASDPSEDQVQVSK